MFQSFLWFFGILILIGIVYTLVNNEDKKNKSDSSNQSSQEDI
jgi:hypothetical protein